ncbi:hypothetical protein LTR37_003676 [Vermiconidia calcicola]|uniref:Uncharacterized protein n=1 Tax=Vermiconidia calcicola TaxID=1690605 RepID=A0ACC3NP83_9PEZI|nr:hypothetical protein LTR37_003676 [Vermiconidia calcicola]
MASGRPIHATSLSNHLIPVTNLSPDGFAPFGQVIQNPATHNDLPGLEHVTANQGTATKWLDVTDMTSHYEMSRSQRQARVAVNMFVCQPRKLEERSDGRRIFNVEILERHPFTPQTFVPLGVSKSDEKTCYLIVVAPTLPSRSWDESSERQPPYPTPPSPKRMRSLKELLLGTRPNPFTNNYAPSTTPPPTKTSSALKPKGPGPPDLANLKAFIARGDQAVTYGPGTWHAPMVVLGEKPIEFVVVQHANSVASEDCQEFEIKSDDVVAVDVSSGIMAAESAKAKL